MLLVQDTIQQFGYDPRELSPASSRPVAVACGDCGSIRVVEFRNVDSLCRSCAGRRKWAAKRTTLECINCGASLTSGQKKFCSNKCGADYSHKQYIKKWLSGQVDGVQSEVWTSRHIRRYIIQTRGERCERCGWSERNPYTGKIPLHLDHIDGNFKNNRPENLRLLCPNCHALTSTYGSRNRGNGRPFKVYKTGQQT